MLISDMWDIVSSMFDLFIISIRNLDWIVISMLNSLIISESLLDWDLVSNGGCVIVSVSPVVGDLLVIDFWLVVGVVLLDGDVLDVGVRLGGLVHSRRGQSLGVRLRQVGAHGGRVYLRLHERSLQWVE